MSIAGAVLEAVRAEMAARPGSRASCAGLRIGEISGVEVESLRFCLEALVPGSEFDPLRFEFEVVPWTRKCRVCGETFPVVEYRTECAKCGSAETEAAGGHEMELAYLEVEET